MAEIKTLFDGHPVFLGEDGLPLIYGKLFFYDVGTTNLKSVYSDAGLATPVDNPLILNDAGRTTVQVFYGVGQYTVHAYKFNGEDPITAELGEWSLDNQFDAEGVASVSASGDVFTVNTVADLRLVDQSAHSFVRVLGYYAAGDMFPRDYHLKTNADVDNGGTIVKNASIAGTSWLNFPQDMVDCRIFGMVAGSTSTYNTQFQSLITYCTTEKKTLYIPKGIYRFTGASFTIGCSIRIDDGVSLRSTGTLTLSFTNKFDIRLTGNIKNAIGNTVVMNFEASSFGNAISPRWFGAALNGSSNDFTALSAMSSIHSKSLWIEFDGIALVSSATADITFKNNIRFISNSGINNTQATNKIIFSGLTIDNKNNGAYNTIAHPINCLSGDLTGFEFSECNEVRSSLFGAGTQGNTENLSTYVKELGATDGTRFVFDSPNNIFDSAISLVESTRWNFVHESGVISNTSEDVIHLTNLSASVGVQCISTEYPVIIHNGEIHYTWFIPNGANETQRKDGYTRSLECAFFGSGQLNLDGLIGASDPFPIIDTRSNVIDDTIASESFRGIKIYNGFVKVLGAESHLLSFDSVAINKIEINSVSVASESGVSCGLVKLDACVVYDTRVFNSNSTAITKGTAAAFDFTSSVMFGKFIIDKTAISAYTLIANSGATLVDLVATDCKNLDCIVNVEGRENLLISGCSSNGNPVVVSSKSSVISGKIVNNVFGNTSITVEAAQVSTRMYGLTITGNDVASIVSDVDGAGAFDTDGHKCVIENNSYRSSIVQMTRGFIKAQVPFDVTGIIVGQYVGCDFLIPDDMFKLPSDKVYQLNCVGSIDSSYSTSFDFIKCVVYPTPNTLRVYIRWVDGFLAPTTGTIDVILSFQSFR